MFNCKRWNFHRDCSLFSFWYFYLYFSRSAVLISLSFKISNVFIYTYVSQDCYYYAFLIAYFSLLYAMRFIYSLNSRILITNTLLKVTMNHLLMTAFINLSFCLIWCFISSFPLIASYISSFFHYVSYYTS